MLLILDPCKLGFTTQPDGSALLRIEPDGSKDVLAFLVPMAPETVRVFHEETEKIVNLSKLHVPTEADIAHIHKDGPR